MRTLILLLIPFAYSCSESKESIKILPDKVYSFEINKYHTGIYIDDKPSLAQKTTFRKDDNWLIQTMFVTSEDSLFLKDKPEVDSFSCSIEQLNELIEILLRKVDINNRYSSCEYMSESSEWEYLEVRLSLYKNEFQYFSVTTNCYDEINESLNILTCN